MTTENILDMPTQPVAKAPASLPVAGAYPLDWETTKVKLGKGREAVMRRPTSLEILARDAEMQTEIPIGRDGGYALPDPTLNDEVDAKYFDLVKCEVTGYEGEMPEQHKAAAFRGLYEREIYVDEDFNLAQDIVPVLEEIGSGVEPDFTIVHVMRPPSESELKLYRRKSAAGEFKPGKRGRQRFVSQSNLKAAVSLYSQWLQEITGATVGGEVFTPELRDAFVNNVDPLVKRQVVNAVVDAYTAKLSD